MLGLWINRFEWVEVHQAPDDLLLAFRSMTGVASVETRPDGWTRVQPEADGVAHSVLQEVVGRGITSVRTGSPSLEDVYLHVMGGRGMEL